MDKAEGLKDREFSPKRSRKRSRSVSSESTFLSMKSNKSIVDPPNLKDGRMSPESRLNTIRSGIRSRSVSTAPSYLTMKSNMSIVDPPNLKDDTVSPGESSNSFITSMLSIRNNWSRDTSNIEKEGDMVLQQSFESEHDGSAVFEKFKSNMQEKFQCLHEGTANQGTLTVLNDIYTKVYITEDGGGEVNNEHEIRQIEIFRRARTEDTPVNLNDIFKPLPGQDKPIRTVLTKGVAGIGKTVSVQKFILDWAEGKANQDAHLILPLPFRELNFMKNQSLSLLGLFNTFFMGTKELEINSDQYKVYIILDGLDECRLSLDFQNSMRLCDATESASVDVLLTNLIVGNLLPSALIWITSRPAAADLIPSECVHRVTEVQGFNDPQKEEYFRKRITDESLAERIISHLKSSRSLFIMCHIPVFCWISATVLEKMLSEAESGEIPKTLTQMYTHFLVLQTKINNEKDYDKKVNDEDMIYKLSKLAFQQLMEGNLIFYEEDLRECGIDVTEASVYSGLCTQIFREEFVLCQRRVYCFVHLTMQEHLAALYVYLSFINNKINVFNITPDQYTTPSMLSNPGMFLSDLLKIAVDKALASANGHLDVFLRFFLGFSLESNHTLLKGLLKQPGSSSGCTGKAIKYIKHKIMENPSPERSINLFHCLNELGDHSLIKEVQHFLNSGTIRGTRLSRSQWSAVAFVLLTSEELDVFHMSKYARMCSDIDEVLVRLLPVIEASKTAHLHYCILSEKCCKALASAVSSNNSCLRELNLNGNGLKDEGAMDFFSGLESPHCKLEVLRLANCKLTDKSCSVMAVALKTKLLSLKELSLNCNNLQDTGVKQLAAGLQNSYCKLEIFKLWNCGFTDEGCTALASALNSNPFHLREVYLDRNKLGDKGINLLLDVLKNPCCKLEILSMIRCGVTDKGCSALASALTSNPSHLRELDLSENKLGDSGVKKLSGGLANPHCKLKILRLMHCGITQEGCAALRSTCSHFIDLDLSGNKLGDSGVKQLSAGHFCNIEILRLMNCGVTDEGCAALASVMKSNSTDLKELYLDKNELRDSGVKVLSAALEHPHCKLETLKLWDCGITDEGCAALAAALTSSPSHLRNLYLFGNKLGYSAVKLLSDLSDDPQNKLENFDLY
ncbi:NACHT, LRR and PYD domains-containing protein 3-like [Sinocyclocheilus grahami]|uniref:NACHT, LRR and PYD domains-containing protein 3-like n=1 Tax=Sinocyclocheilus grahami TaxID=75366 RepID=UPI0007ACF09D|nr:PREDICTED: NACHT, LRR and PYD domains-containing protein 3-like [Sinocyclocheilus grahami]XP_016128383.1 PREDICTED: NACHT, LRR and PYD domains-containing protein 3-like [Sinocyclocheilus grahami]